MSGARTTSEFKVERVASVTDWRGIPEGVLVLECEGSLIKWIFLVCPCGCAEALYIPLAGRGLPLYVARERDGKVTLDPAIDRAGKCGARFKIVRNVVEWLR